MSENAKPPSFWLLAPIAIFTRMYPQFPGRGESCIRPALVPQGRSQGSPLLKGHRQLQTALSCDQWALPTISWSVAALSFGGRCPPSPFYDTSGLRLDAHFTKN